MGILVVLYDWGIWKVVDERATRWGILKRIHGRSSGDSIVAVKEGSKEGKELNIVNYNTV